MISLVDMYREIGQPEEALAAAVKIAEASPSDTKALLDVAELNARARPATTRPQQAFERIREVDELPDHEVYALHGMIQLELAPRGLRPRARARPRGERGRLARAARTDVVAFLEAQRRGRTRSPAPDARRGRTPRCPRSLAEHRRLARRGPPARARRTSWLKSPHPAGR